MTSLFLYEAIRTTRNRARVIQGIVDRLIATAKRQDTHVAIRSLNAYVTDKNASRKVMQVFKDRYKTRTSGFTIVKAAGARKGDGAQLVDLMLVDAEIGTPKAAPAKKETKPKAAKAPTKKAAAEKTPASTDSSTQA